MLKYLQTNQKNMSKNKDNKIIETSEHSNSDHVIVKFMINMIKENKQKQITFFAKEFQFQHSSHHKKLLMHQ